MIKRYFIDQDDDGDACACFMTQDSEGEYVTYADHIEVVRGLVEALTAALRNIPTGPSSLRWQIEAAIAKHQEEQK